MSPSLPPASRAPWWANWLLQTAIAIGVIFSIAAGLDWIWLDMLGRPAWAVCGLLGLLPLGLTVPLGGLFATVGIVTTIIGRKTAGIALLCLGAVLYSTTDLLEALGVTNSCPWLGVV